MAMQQRKKKAPAARRSGPAMPRKPRSRNWSSWTFGEAKDGLAQMWSMADAGYKLLRNEEVKMFDTQFTANPTWSGGINHISNILVGDTFLNRDGNSIKVVGMEVSWRAVITGNATTHRILVLSDNECAGANPGAAAILESVGTIYTPQSPYYHASTRRITTIRDDTVTWGEGAPTGSVTRTGRFVLPMQHHILYDGSAGTVADAREGNLFIATFGDAAASGCTFTVNTRLFFVDN